MTAVELYGVSALDCVCGLLQARCVDTTPIVMHPALCLFAWQIRFGLCHNVLSAIM